MRDLLTRFEAGLRLVEKVRRDQVQHGVEEPNEREPRQQNQRLQQRHVAMIESRRRLLLATPSQNALFALFTSQTEKPFPE